VLKEGVSHDGDERQRNSSHHLGKSFQTSEHRGTPTERTTWCMTVFCLASALMCFTISKGISAIGTLERSLTNTYLQIVVVKRVNKTCTAKLTEVLKDPHRLSLW
jgi:hypothetical protein